MDVELLVTGDELVRGSIVDTNSPWLLERLAAAGARVGRIVTVGDDRAHLLRALREATARADVLVVSGGLGPTSDDLTAECAAELVDSMLVLHQPTIERLKARWSLRGRPIPAGAEKQALVPEAAEVLPNDVGTAPGFRLKVGRTWVYFFAGVPSEFKHLSQRHLLPFVSGASSSVAVTRTLRCVSMTESELDAALGPLAARAGVKLGLRAVFPESWASLTVRAETAVKAQAALDPMVEEAQGLVGSACFSTRDETLEEVVGALLLERGETISVAESCTGGLLGGALTAVAGSSAYFAGGVVAYSYAEKIRALGVSASLLESQGAVSEEVACAMATGVRESMQTTWGVSVTGIAGPGGATPDKPVGTVWMGVAGPAGVTAHLLKSTRPHRDSVREHSVAVALDLLRRRLIESGA